MEQDVGTGPASAPRRVFKDPVLQASFEKDGYVVVPLLGPDEVEYALRGLDVICPAERAVQNPEYMSYLSPDRELAKATSDFIKSVVGPRLRKYLTDYRVLSSLLIHKPGGAERLPVHLHPPQLADFTDTLVVSWCPLIDSDERTGALQVVPGAHRLLWHPNASGGVPYWGGEDTWIAKKLVTLRVQAGEAVLFDNTLPHGSCHNLTEKARPAFVSLIMPEDATAAFYIEPELPGQDIEIYRALDEFSYADLVHQRMPPRESWELLGTLRDRRVLLNEAQFEALLRNGVHVAPGIDPYEAVAALASATHSSEAASAPVNPQPRRSLVRRAFSRLRRDFAAGVFS